MLDLDSEIWQYLDGGYRIEYDATVLLRDLLALDDPRSVWDEIWNELHHQGDVGTASYAVMPWLLRIYREKDWVDFNLPAYAFAVERARMKTDNPAVPDWLYKDYENSLNEIAGYCLSKKADCPDPNFKKAMVLLTAVLVEAGDIVELLDCVSIGDEKRALELYESDVL
jgi:hypothetical protein